MRRYFWIIPFVMMAIAALACDSPNYDPPQVRDVLADPNIPGKAYALVGGTQYSKIDSFYDPIGDVQQVYETRDYGQTWARTTEVVPFSSTPSADSGIAKTDSINPKSLLRIVTSSSSGEFSVADSNSVITTFWTFPRGMFRQFFYSFDGNGDERPYFKLPYASAYSASAVDPNVIFVSAGSEGVLVGPNPFIEPMKRPDIPWKLTNTGLDLLTPVPLIITSLDQIIGIIFAALIFPPLSLLHYLFLSRAYRYAFQPGEQREVNQFTSLVTGIITALAVVAIIIWLTNDSTDYYLVVAVMTVICVALSAGGGVWISRKRKFTNKFTRRMGVASGLLALIVPIGVASIYVAWPLILAALFLFQVVQRVIERELARQHAVMTNWQADRLAIEVSLAVALLTVPVGMLALFVLNNVYDFRDRQFGSLASLAFVFTVLAISTAAVGVFIRIRAGVTMKKKGTEPEVGLGSAEGATPLFTSTRWWREIYFGAMTWAVGTAIGSALLFMAQFMVMSAFNKMLVG